MARFAESSPTSSPPRSSSNTRNNFLPPMPGASISKSRLFFAYDNISPKLSVMLLGASLFFILAERYGPKDKHWAYGTVGTIIGFWRKV